MITCDVSRVLVFSTKVFEVVMLVYSVTEKYLIMDINLLLRVVMRIQGCNSFIYNLNSSFFSCFYKVIVNLSVCSISLNSFKDRS